MAVDPARVKILFIAASELEAANRLAYLDRECGGDVELRARVEALLRVDDASPLPPQGDVNRTGAYTPNDLDPGVEQVRGSSWIGTVLAGKYRLIGEIGAGGMGSVYLAEQTEPVKRQVALKLIKNGMDSKAVLARFDAERQALALMDHPNIARIYDGGATPAGQPFFVMELVKGAPLTDYCDSQRLPVRARLELFISVCQAVQHAHQKGIIHRDLKPGNVLVTEVDGRPTPKVIDFGVAKATEQKLTDFSFADTGAIVGTPTYMSPEQADPTLMDIDTRTDVYALGVILYELLAGSPPLEAKQFKQGAILELLRMVREVDPPRPSTKLSSAKELPSIAANRSVLPAKLAIDLRGELDWVVMKAIEKDRNRRYESANAFASDLQRYLADEVVEARPPSAGYRLKKFVSRHKGQVIAASLVMIALLGGIVGTTLGLFEARKQEEMARGETSEKEKARLAEARRVVERDKALKAEAERSDELRYRLGVSAMVLASVAYENRDVEVAAAQLEQVPIAQRGWEWRYLKQRTIGGEFTLPGLSQGMWNAENTAVAFSPDGDRIVTGLRDNDNHGALRVWDARTGTLVTELKGIEHNLMSAVFTTDGSRLVTLEWPPTIPGQPFTTPIKVWDAKTWNLLLDLKKPQVNAIALSPDGNSLVAAGERLEIWDLRTDKLVLELEVGKADPQNMLSSVAFSTDGKRIVASGLRGDVRIWDAQKGGAAKLTPSLPAPPFGVNMATVSFNPDGTRIIAGYSNGLVKVLDAATGTTLFELKSRKGQSVGSIVRLHFVYPRSAAFSPDGSRIVLASGDNGAPEATVWDARTGAELLILTGHTAPILCAAFSADGMRIVTGSEDGTAKVWNARTGAPRFDIGGEQRLMASAFSPIEDRMVVAGKKTTIIDVRTGAAVQELGGLAGGARCTAYSHDGTRIVVAGGTVDQPGKAAVWDVRDGKVLFQIEGLVSPVNDVCFSPDGAWIATTAIRTRDKPMEFKIWDATNGQLLHDLTKPDRESFLGERGGTIAFSPDGSRFVTGSILGPFEATVWDVKTLKPLFALRSGREILMSVAFSGDGSRILTGGSKTVKMWDADTGRLLPVELQGHAGDVLGCAFSPDGTRIVTGSADRTARIWDARTGTTLLELKGHAGFVHRVAFNPDGTRLAAVIEQQKKEAELIVWEAPVTTFLPVLRRHDSLVRTATFSPDGTRIVVITLEGTARVWDIRAAAVQFEMSVPNGHIGGASFTADGTRIVTQESVTIGRKPERRTAVRDARTGNVLPNEKIPDTIPAGPISLDGRYYAHVVDTRVEFFDLKPDAEELVRRRRQAQPDAWRHRLALDEARAAKDDFAARFHTKMLP